MKKYAIHILYTFFFIVCFQHISYSQDTLKQKKIVFNGYVKDLQTVFFQDVKSDWITENMIHNRLNFKWLISPSFTASAEFRTRFVFGNMLTAIAGYNKTFETDNGMVNLSKNLLDEKSFLLNMTIDRLWIEYVKNNFQFTLGRQRINWSQTFVWNPNDIFNTYSYFDFDYEEKPGSDAFRMQYYSSASSVFEIAAKLNKAKNLTIAGLYRFNKWNYDIQFVGGLAEQDDLFIGAGWSGQLLKGGFRGETNYFHPVKSMNDTSGIFIAVAGYDYTFKNSVFLQIEALYNGNKDSVNLISMGQTSYGDLSAKNLFLSDFSLFGSVTYPFTPLVSGSFAGINNFRSKLFVVVPSINISLKENLELSFTAQLLQYYSHSNSQPDLYLFFGRLKSSF